MTTGSPPTTAQADPWSVAADAMERVRAGGPPALRVEIVRALGALGLTELAAAWTDTIPATADLAPTITKIRAVLPTLAPSEIPRQRLEANARAALASRPDLAESLGPHIDAWAEALAEQAWYRTKDGNVVSVRCDAPIDSPGAVLRFGDEQKRARSSAIPTIEGDPNRRAVVMDRVRSAASLRNLAERFPRMPNGAWAALHALEPDPRALLDALAGEDLTDLLAEDRLFLYTGPGCAQELISTLGERSGEWANIVYCPDHTGGPDNTLRAALDELSRTRLKDYQQLLAKNNEAYAERDAAWWSERFTSARASAGEPLRALVITTRFSTFIRHSSADICEAFELSGVRAALLIEASDHASYDGLTIARAIDEHNPDFVVIINYTRSHFGASMPPGIPFVCWIQDAMPHLFSDDTASDVDGLSVVVGGVFTELCTRHAYPDSRCLRFGVPASDMKFSSPVRGTAEQGLLVVTNHGESPSEMADRLENECVSSGGPRGMILGIAERLANALEAWDAGYPDNWIPRTIRPVIERFGIDPGGDNALRLLQQAGRPLVDRMLRHRTVEWAADIAESRGLKLTIAGKGWASHPSLGKHSIGQVDHGPALRDLYNASTLTLHASATWIHHQRILECLFAGGMPAMLYKPYDLAAILRPAFLHARTALRPTCTHPVTGAPCVGVWDDPLFPLAISIAQRVTACRAPSRGGEDEAQGWYDAVDALESGLIAWHGDWSQAKPSIRELATPHDELRYLDAVSPMFFRSKEDLGALLDRASDNPRWRTAQIEHARGIARKHYTYTNAIDGVVRLLQDSITLEAEKTDSPAS